MAGLDVGAVVHWTGQYEDDNISLTGATKLNEPRSGPQDFRARKVSAWTTLDLVLNCMFNVPTACINRGARLCQGWREECEDEGQQGKERGASIHG
jgi:hypothetical protein